MICYITEKKIKEFREDVASSLYRLFFCSCCLKIFVIKGKLTKHMHIDVCIELLCMFMIVIRKMYKSQIQN